MKKMCNKCNKEKGLHCFGVNNKKKDKLKHHCKECETVYRRSRYEYNKHRISKENKKGHQKRKELYYNNIKEYLGISDVFTCTCCGYSHKYLAVFDWHHLEPTQKDIEISSMVRHSKDKLFKELDKCILLCSNCHRILHYEENIKTC